MLFDVLRKNGVKFALKEVHKGALRQMGLRKRLPKHTQPFASFSKQAPDAGNSKTILKFYGIRYGAFKGVKRIQ
jgi:hypothetical protein